MDLLNQKTPKDTIRTRFLTIRQYDNLSIGNFEAVFLTIKSYICQWFGRVRKVNWDADRVNFNIDIVPYYYGKVSSNFNGDVSTLDWNESGVEHGYFKNWYIQNYSNGT